MISTLYFYEENAIGYWTPNLKEAWVFDFEDFSKHYYYTEGDGAFSTLLSQLMKVSKDSTNRVYHLAALIKKREPDINWGLEEQLYIFEKNIRLEKYQETVFKQMDIRRKPTFHFEYQMIDFEVEFGSRIREIEPDELLEHRVKAKLKFWENV